MNTRKWGRPLLVAKIEKAEAMENLDDIIANTDGVMVARGDLGVETSVGTRSGLSKTHHRTSRRCTINSSSPRRRCCNR
jgi:pyruvate kinase